MFCFDRFIAVSFNVIIFVLYQANEESDVEV